MSKKYSRYQSAILNPRQAAVETYRGTDEPDDDLSCVCQKCGAVVTQYDAAGTAWCGQPFCDARARLVNRGYVLHFPKVAITGAGINPGRAGWVAFAQRATEERVQALLDAVTTRPMFGQEVA